MTHKEILEALRGKMRECGCDGYILGCGDYHGSEYVSEYFLTLQYLCGFSGESSLVVVTPEKAGLWTDGRYWLQAERELTGSTVELYRAGLPGVISVSDFLKAELPEGGTLGFDGKVIPMSQAEEWEKALADRKISLKADRDLVGELWAERPALRFTDSFLLPEKYTGESTASKLERIRRVMAEKGADRHLITALDDIAWILNCRGDDVPCTPVIFSFLDIAADSASWYVNENSVTEEVRAYVCGQGVTLRPYQEIWTAVSAFPTDCTLLLDGGTVSYYFKAALPEGVKLIKAMNPSSRMKCVKNAAEIEAQRAAQKKDGAAMVKFLYHLLHLPDVSCWSEMDALHYLDNCRREQGAFEMSFDTISAMGANAAEAHYAATPEKYSMLEPKGFYLVDSGGQYLEGTTDITRTVALGPLTEEQKKSYTLVLRAMLRLAGAKFPEGLTGCHLDVLARQPLWKEGLDFRHGTGHGVGMCLGVHEGPNSFRWALPQNPERLTVFEPGMITTDEPGLYADNAYGIRIENDLLCVEAERTEFGRFLAFESMTLCPIDLTPVNRADLLQDEIDTLNAYHERVYETLQDALTEEERQWLREVTRAI